MKNLINKLKSNEDYLNYIMILPAFILLIGVMYPFVISVLTTFTDKKLYMPSFKIIFFDNFINNFANPIFITSFLNTIFYTLLAIGIQLPLGIFVALLLDKESAIRPVLRSVLVFPLLITPIVSSLMWKTMMHPSGGVLNYLLSLIGIKGFSWLTSLDTALISIVLIDCWIYMPFISIIILAGLQSLSVDVMEASQIDGASEIQKFFKIKLPHLYPYIILTLLFRVCDSLKAFEIIYSTTRGGPIHATRTLNIMAYEEAFRWSNIARALSIIFLLWLISYTISTFLVKKWEQTSNR